MLSIFGKTNRYCGLPFRRSFATSTSDDFVTVVEVGPRDGLQNEKQVISTEDKVSFIDALSGCNFTRIEVTSFVSPKWIPQLADSAEVYAKIVKNSGTRYSTLVPNVQGLQKAIELKVPEVAIFTAASESFCRKNINCSIEESLRRFDPVLEQCRQHDILVRGYVSCIVGCPYEGKIDPKAVAAVCESLLNMGCYEVSLGDTIGVATPKDVSRVLEAVSTSVPVSKLAVHFHDTYGQAVANACAALDHDVRTLDSSVAGLGGCPYAKGASGNVATEDIVYTLDGLGLHHGIDLPKLVDAGQSICDVLNRTNQSKVGSAMRS